MMGYTHFPAGMLVGLTLANVLPQTTLSDGISFLFLGGVGGLLPDIDSRNSKISQHFPLFGWLASKLTKHRGITHTLFFWSLLFLPLAISVTLLQPYLFALMVGVFSHLCLDACTVRGCRMFAPFYKKRIRFSKIKTGSGLESFVCALIYLLLFAASYFFVCDIWGISC